MNKPEKMLLTEFDAATGGMELQMLKALLPFADPGQQKTLAIFIRIFELMSTISYYQNLVGPSPLCRSNNNQKDILDELKKYCPKDNMKWFDMMSDFSNMEKMYSILNTESFSNNEKTKDMSGFLTPKQKEMYESYKKILNM